MAQSASTGWQEKIDEACEMLDRLPQLLIEIANEAPVSDLMAGLLAGDAKAIGEEYHFYWGEFLTRVRATTS